jgi:Condensin II complex subunit CAP-H2 or CNDH2, C-term
VSQWQAKLAPILEEEERRAAFDIHRYSQDLLETAKQRLQGIKRKSDGSEHVRIGTRD